MSESCSVSMVLYKQIPFQLLLCGRFVLGSLHRWMRLWLAGIQKWGGISLLSHWIFIKSPGNSRRPRCTLKVSLLLFGNSRSPRPYLEGLLVGCLHTNVWALVRLEIKPKNVSLAWNRVSQLYFGALPVLQNCVNLHCSSSSTCFLCSCFDHWLKILK